MRDVVSDQFSLDGRLPRTLGSLFFRPGKLTREYLQGRVRSYVLPFRLYLFSSILFFILLGSLGIGGLDSVGAPEDGPTLAGSTDTVAAGGWGWDEADVQVNTGSAILDRIIQDRLRRLSRMEPVEAIQEVVRIVLRYVPTLLFILLPLFATVFAVVYWRQRRVFLEHFIFVLHVHAFLFSVASVLLVMTSLGQGWVAGPLQLGLWVYLFLALRRFYGQGRRKTLFKLILITLAYMMILASSLPFLLIASFLLWG